MNDSKSKIARTTQPYLFQNGSLLTDLPVQDLAMLQDKAKTESFKRGDVLFRRGAFPKSIYWLKSGKVKIFQETPSGHRQTLYIYSDGDLIGYRQLISEEAHPVSALLLEDSEVTIIPGEIFRSVINSSSFFARNLLAALAREFSVWMNRTTVFTQFSVRRRLILALLILSEQYRISGSKPGVVTMTRTELAEYVGATLETVVRALNKLKAEGFVKISGRQIVLPDVMGLITILEKEDA